LGYPPLAMELPVFVDQILFVIVLYKRRPEQSPSFRLLQKLATKEKYTVSIFAYDNSPEPLNASYPSVFYRHDPKNNGVSKAYNEAALYAEGLKKKWLMLFDQDTLPDERFLGTMLESVQNHPTCHAFVPQLTDNKGLVSPFRWRLGKGKRITLKENRLSLAQYRFVNSGLLIALTAFKEVRGYEESIPLDFSDIAFGEKLRAITQQFIVTDSVWQHSLSDSGNPRKEEASLRFDFFCSGSFKMGEVFGTPHILLLRAFARSIKLSIRYRAISFVKIFFRHTLHG
jgi:rhamnosyltransferase